MNRKYKSVEERLEHMHFSDLSQSEQDRVWLGIASDMKKEPVISPWLLPIHSKRMVPLLVALALFAGMGGTTVAANSAVPGDTLFTLDRAVEEIRLALADDDRSSDLKVLFAEERLAELERIIERSRKHASASTTATSTTKVLKEVEADAFTNETVVKVEFTNNKKEVFTTPADTREEVVAVVANLYKTATSTVNAILDYEVEDRASRLEDKIIRGDDADDQVSMGVSVALSFLNSIADDVEASGNKDAEARIAGVINRIEDLVNEEDISGRIKNNGEFRMEINTDLDEQVKIRTEGNKDRIEIRSEGERIRIEVKKDGEVKVKTKLETGGNSNSNQKSNSGKGKDKKDEVRNDNSVNILEIEADIFTDQTIVTVEVNNNKTSFVTSADTKSEIVDEVLKRFTSLSRTQVESVIEVETEDRASRANDLR